MNPVKEETESSYISLAATNRSRDRSTSYEDDSLESIPQSGVDVVMGDSSGELWTERPRRYSTDVGRVFIHDRIPSVHLMKRRRAKRSEAERIEYLRSDPYVSKFEPYRVLCASCNRWIRLRPNSTYCSIPWESHRKSCLGKRVPKNDTSVEYLNHMFSQDPAIRKYDSERVLCRVCDIWVQISASDYQQSIDIWFEHRAGCTTLSPPPLAASYETPSSYPVGTTLKRRPTPSSMDKTAHRHLSEAVPSKNHIILPPLIAAGSTSPGSLLSRPSSSSAEAMPSPPSSSYSSTSISWPESNSRSSDHSIPSPVNNQQGMFAFRPDSPLSRPSSPYTPKHARPVIANLLQSPADQPSMSQENHSFTPPTTSTLSTNKRPSKRSSNRVDLESSHGRCNFILSTILHLYSTTYESSDELTISLLLSYLNSALPPDKYEEFDTPEVVKAALALQERGKIVFRGDSLRPFDR